MLRTKKPKRHVSCQRRVERPIAEGIDEGWSMDFMSNGLFVERRSKSLAIVDNFARESMAIKVAPASEARESWGAAPADGATSPAHDNSG